MRTEFLSRESHEQNVGEVKKNLRTDLYDHSVLEARDRIIILIGDENQKQVILISKNSSLLLIWCPDLDYCCGMPLYFKKNNQL